MMASSKIISTNLFASFSNHAGEIYSLYESCISYLLYVYAVRWVVLFLYCVFFETDWSD